MNKLFLPNYNLKSTLLGGQAFNFDYFPEEDYYIGFTRHSLIKLKKENDFILWQTFPKKNNFNLIKNYLKSDVNYENILKIISKDKHIKKAIKTYPGLRILNQNFDENLLSFILSSNNNIKSIRKSLREICKKFGKKIKHENKIFYLFPEIEVIANAEIEELLESKIGFRAKYLKGAAKYLLENNLNKKIKNISEENARNELLKINGVGEKIADCVLMFSLGYENVMPLDVWAKRALINFYKLDEKMKYVDMRNWVKKYFNGYASYAAQFLFEYVRMGK